MLAGVPDAHWRPRLADMLEELAQFVEARRGDLCVDVLPGVVAVLEHLRSRGAKLGVGTGNLERIGWAKLERCGLRVHFDFGGFSDAVEWRRDMIAGAAEKARDLAGAGAAICVVGDLRGSQPDLLVGSLRELLRTESAPNA